jgi:endonuclease-3
MRLIPRKKWFRFSYQLIDHGRAICRAKKPLCTACPVEPLCPSSQA